MTDIVDGIFFHNEGGGYRDVLERLSDGRANPRLDNPFAPAFREVRSRIEKAKKAKAAAELKVRLQDREIEELEKTQAELDAAYERFIDYGKVDELLLPSCDELLAEQKSAACEDVCLAAEAAIAPEIKPAIDAGWEIKGKRANENYVYITLRRRREEFETEERPSEMRLVEQIHEAIVIISEEHRACLRPRIVSQSRNPAAP